MGHLRDTRKLLYVRFSKLRRQLLLMQHELRVLHENVYYGAVEKAHVSFQ